MKILFTGDICVSGSFKRRLAAGQAWWNTELQTLIDAHQVKVVNLEGPLLAHPRHVRIYNPPSTLSKLLSSGFHVYNLANNHTTDGGTLGLAETIRLIQTAGGDSFGAGMNWSEASRPYWIHTPDQKIAIIAATHCDGLIATTQQAGVYAPKHDRAFRSYLASIAQEADTLILCYHGDEEYTTYPWPARRKWLQSLAKGPVDAIVCHHPHVVQGVEWVDEVPIMYSLGNALFDVPNHYHRSHTDVGAWLSLTVHPAQKPRVTVHLVQLDRKAGTLSLASEEVNTWWKGLCDFSQADQQWQKEAARVIRQSHLERPEMPFSEQATPSAPPSAPPPRWQKMFRPTFYRTLFRYLRYRNTRALLLAAMAYWLRGNR